MKREWLTGPAARGFAGALAAIALVSIVWYVYAGLHGLKVQSDQDHRTIAQIVDYLNKQIAQGRH